MEAINALVHAFVIGLNIEFDNGDVECIDRRFDVYGGLNCMEKVDAIKEMVVEDANKREPDGGRVAIDVYLRYAPHLLFVREVAYNHPLFGGVTGQPFVSSG